MPLTGTDPANREMVAPVTSSAEKNHVADAQAQLAELADNLGDHAVRAINAAKSAIPTMRYGAALHELATAFAWTGEEDELCRVTAAKVADLVNVAYPPGYVSLGTNRILAAAAELVKACTELYTSDDHVVVQENWFEESPALHGPARYGSGAAALLMAALGPDAIGDLESEPVGCGAQNALQIASVYTSLPVVSPLALALEAVALLALRETTEGVPDDNE